MKLLANDGCKNQLCLIIYLLLWPNQMLQNGIWVHLVCKITIWLYFINLCAANWWSMRLCVSYSEHFECMRNNESKSIFSSFTPFRKSIEWIDRIHLAEDELHSQQTFACFEMSVNCLPCAAIDTVVLLLLMRLLLFQVDINFLNPKTVRFLVPQNKEIKGLSAITVCNLVSL